MSRKVPTMSPIQAGPERFCRNWVIRGGRICVFALRVLGRTRLIGPDGETQDFSKHGAMKWRRKRRVANFKFRMGGMSTWLQRKREALAEVRDQRSEGGETEF